MLHKGYGQRSMFGSVAAQRKTFPFIHNHTSNAHVPRAPHRRLKCDSPTALGVGRASTRIPLLVEKPIVRSPRPSEFNEYLRTTTAVPRDSSRSRVKLQTTLLEDKLPTILRDDHVQLLSRRRLYTSTTREATEEAALPTPRRNVPRTTLEREADPVRCRAVRYSPRPCEWQHYAREWDAMQLRRAPDTNRVPCDLTLPQIGNNCSLLLQENTEPENLRHKAEKEFVFMRPMPGYGGFVPRHAVEQRSHTEADCITDSMCSTSRRTYRNFPASEYKVLEYAHKGPFSKTVTMTHPLNPFNKVEHQTYSY